MTKLGFERMGLKMEHPVRACLVTGAARRLGRAIALKLAGTGWDVVVHYHRSSDEAAQVAAQVEGLGRRAWLVQADLSAPDQVAGLVDQAVGKAGRVDGLVNNASIFPAGRLLDLEWTALADNLQVNAFAPFVLARDAARQGAASIVNLLDTRVVDYDREHAAYHLSKRALFSLTRMLALELAPGVRVNAVAPGLVLPPPGKGLDYLERYRGTNPLESIGTADEVAQTVHFLIEAAFITGQIVFVDGGRHMRGGVYGL